jgi:asparagine synthase (glutamine-hydrolysing)
VNTFLGRISKSTPFRIEGGPFHRDGDIAVFFRGYIANSAAVAETCGVPIVREDTARLFLAAYRRWGRDLQRHVLGEYALAVMDVADGKLLLTQDGVGTRPLFVADLAGRIVFASHLHLMVDELPALRIDEAYLMDHLRMSRHLGLRSPFRDVTRLIGGETLEWSKGKLRRTRIWSLAGVRPIARRSEGEYEEEFRSLLNEAVQSAAPCGSKIWMELSGGLDSSSIASVAARQSLPAEAVSLIFSQTPSVDERPWMRKVIERYGLTWNTFDCEQLLPFSCWPNEPFGEPNLSICTFAYIRAQHNAAAQRGVSVIFSGNGGDHVLLGDKVSPVFLADDLLRGRFASLNRGIRSWQRESIPTRPYRVLLGQEAVGPALDRLRGRTIRNGADLPLPSYLHPDQVRRYRLKDRTRTIAGVPSPTAGGQHFAERVREASVLLSMNVNQYRDAVEIRYPLLYRPLVEFMYAIPWNRKLEPGSDRLLHRRAMAGILPEAVRRRVTKASIAEPCIKGLKAGGTNLLAELTENSRLVHYGLVDESAWRKAVNLAIHGMVDGLSQFMAAVSAEIWLQQIEGAFSRKALSGGGQEQACQPLALQKQRD